MYGLYKDEKKYFVQTRNTHDKNKLIVQSGNHGILNRIANNLNLSLPVVQLNKNIDSENSEEENIIEQPTKSNTIIHKSFETSLNVTGQKNCNNINLRKLRVECSNPDNTRKRNFCYYCKKIIWIHVAKHFEQMHKDEEDVKKCLLLPKGNRERQRIIKNLRQKGNYLFNQNPAYNKGELIVCRRPTGKKTASDFICCVDCKGFFSKNAMYMHSRRCTEKGVDRSVIQLGKKTQSQIHECANSILRNVFPSKEDNITRLIRYDELVIIYGNNLCEKYTDRETIRYRLRLLGRFLQTLRKINKNVTDFYSLYHPSVYDDCITALKQLTGFNTSTKVYALHSVASILYAFLRQMGNIGIAECIKRNKLEEKINIENFLQLFQEDYNKFVNKNDKNSMLQDECNQLQELLSSDDIKLLHYFLQTNRRLAVQQLKDTFTYNAWRQLAEFTLISIQVFNRKRKKAEIIECMSIDDYKHQEGIKINEYPDMYERISLPDEAREENAALCDQVAHMQENLMLVKEERLFLLRKLCQQQGEMESNSTSLARSQTSNTNSPSLNPECSTPKKTIKKRTSIDGSESKNKTKRYNKTARRVVQLIPLDVHGRPIFPIALGELTIYSLGEVVSDRIAYHTEELIFPVGYCSTRVYANLRDPRTKSLYTCKILDSGAKPRFEIVSDNDLDQSLVGSSPDECHSKLLAAISPMLCTIVPKGADFFGISHSTVQNLIQSSPGTRKLAMYKQQRFEVCIEYTAF